MFTEVKHLYSQLSFALIKDRHALRKRLNKIEADRNLGKSIQEPLAQWSQWLQKSIANAEARYTRTPLIDYPKNLPIVERITDIQALLKCHQVIVVAGETGSGKTTQLPKIALALGLARYGTIAHTQPRRMAAQAVAKRLAHELQCELGEQVGYQVRFQDQTSSDTLLKLMTDGILLAEIRQDPYLNRYQTIIIDEAHERSLNIDFLLGYLKQLITKRPELKLIITSATIDLKRFSEHFDQAPVLEISGRTYPVEVCYRPLLLPGMCEARPIPEAILETVYEIEALDIKRGQVGDVLIFLPGERDIREAAECLRKAQLKSAQILPLYARLSFDDQNKIFSQRLGRRIVLSTNIAETSLTVPGIRYVIDTGLARISRYSYRARVQRLPIEPIAQANAQQRKGRCGRLAEGVCFRLYSEEDLLSRPEYTEPEILRTNLAAVILKIFDLNLGAIEDFPLMQMPDSRFVKDGFTLLKELGAMVDNRLTTLGRQLASLPIDPRLGRILIEGASCGCLTEMLIIVSALAAQDPREWPVEKKAKAEQCHSQWRDEASDFVEFLNLWFALEEKKLVLSKHQFKQYCQDEFLSYQRFREWRETHRQLHLLTKQLQFQENTEPASYHSIHQALLAGLLSQIGCKTDEADYRGARQQRFVVIAGSQKKKQRPKWCMVAELFETHCLYGRVIAKIEPEWVEPLAQHLIKRQYSEPHWEKKRGQVVAYEQVSLYGLILIPKRLMYYETIDLIASRDIFLRSALVEQQIITRGDFLEYNKILISEVKALEEKSRKRDILVDDEVLYQFYNQIIPQHIANTKNFEQWRSSIERAEPAFLKLTREYLLRSEAVAVTEIQFPTKWPMGDVLLPLSYRFEPGHLEDGVSLQVPVDLIRRLSQSQLEWLVPGFLEQKIVALLKSLPKIKRRTLMPILQLAEAFLAYSKIGQGDLLEQLIAFVRSARQVLLEPTDFNLSALEPHFRFNIQVIDHQAQVLAQSRELAQLLIQFREVTEKADAMPGVSYRARNASSHWERDQVLAWDFGNLPTSTSVAQGGLVFELFPTLVVEGSQVALRLVDHPRSACWCHQAGLVKLAALLLDNQLKSWQKLLVRSFDRSLVLAYAGLGTQQQLAISLTEAMILQLLPALSLRRQSDFEQWLRQIKAEGWQHLQSLLSMTQNALVPFAKLRARTKQLNNIAFTLAYSDINMQLSGLFNKKFPYGFNRHHLMQFPRYLQAIDNRLNKLSENIHRDKLNMMVLTALQEPYQQYLKQVPLPVDCYPEFQVYRWLLEEMRVSLFAQHLGTAESVSEQRLKIRWQEIQQKIKSDSF